MIALLGREPRLVFRDHNREMVADGIQASCVAEPIAKISKEVVQVESVLGDGRETDDEFLFDVEGLLKQHGRDLGCCRSWKWSDARL